MDRRAAPAASRQRRRRVTLLWSAVAAAVVITLLITEQVAVLYVLATLGVSGLLLVVAWSDLGAAHKQVTEEPPRDDAAAIADGVTSRHATTLGGGRPRPTKR